MEKLKKNKYTLLILCIVFICILFLNIYSLMSPDEYNYSHITWTNQKLQSFFDILKSLKILYIQWTGRVICTGLIQFFTFIGVNYFYILNPIVFILFIVGIVKFSNIFFYNKKIDIFSLITVMFLILYTTVCFGEKFIWMSGALNYLWPVCAMIYYLLVLYQIIVYEKSLNIFQNIIFLILSFVVGLSQENVVFFSGMYIIFILFFNLKNILKANKKRIALILISLISFGIGAAILIFAPGNFSRLDSSQTHFSVVNIIKNLWHIKYLILSYVITAIIVYIKSKKDEKDGLNILDKSIKNGRQLLKRELIYFVFPGIIAMLPMIIISEFPDRAMLSYEVCIIILVITNLKYLLNIFKVNQNYLRCVSGIMLIFIFLELGYAVFVEYNYYRPYKEYFSVLFKQANQNDIKEVVVNEFEHYDKLKKSDILLDFFPKTLDGEIINSYMAIYYNLDSIMAKKENEYIVEVTLFENDNLENYNVIEIESNNIVSNRILNFQSRMPNYSLENRLIFKIPKDNIGTYFIALPSFMEENIKEVLLRDTLTKEILLKEEVIKFY